MSGPRADDSGPATFWALWRSAVQRRPGSTFLVFEQESGQTSEWTYAQLDRVVDGLAGRLSAAGVGRGGTVHLALRNSPEFVAVWLAVARLGARMVAADPQAAAAELSDQWLRTRPTLGICTDRNAATYETAAAERTLPTWNVREDGTTAGEWQEATPLASADEAAAGPMEDLAVMFTSGTTSRPKGVVLSQGLYAFTGRTMAQATGLDEQSRWLVVLPLFHANAQYYCISSAVAAGASVALTARFSASRWAQQARRHAATHASLFASPMRMVLSRTPAGTGPLSLTSVWYAQNLGHDELDRFAALAGCAPRQLYGMTETGPAVLTDRADPPTPGLLGTPTPGCRLRLVDPVSQRPVAVGAVGALQVHGSPGRSLFTHYLDSPEETARAFTAAGEGRMWFTTGDSAYVDAAARFCFHGRGSDIIKVGGENVSLVEVEAVLATHPDLVEVAAAAEHDAVLDEVVVAYAVTRHPGTVPDAQTVLDWAASHLSPPKRPRRITFVSALPKTSVGKIRRFALAAETPTAGSPAPRSVAR